MTRMSIVAGETTVLRARAPRLLWIAVLVMLAWPAATQGAGAGDAVSETRAVSETTLTSETTDKTDATDRYLPSAEERRLEQIRTARLGPRDPASPINGESAPNAIADPLGKSWNAEAPFSPWIFVLIGLVTLGGALIFWGARRWLIGQTNTARMTIPTSTRLRSRRGQTPVRPEPEAETEAEAAPAPEPAPDVTLDPALEAAAALPALAIVEAPPEPDEDPEEQLPQSPASRPAATRSGSAGHTSAGLQMRLVEVSPAPETAERGEIAPAQETGGLERSLRSVLETMEGLGERLHQLEERVGSPIEAAMPEAAMPEAVDRDTKPSQEIPETGIGSSQTGATPTKHAAPPPSVFDLPGHGLELVETPPSRPGSEERPDVSPEADPEESPDLSRLSNAREQVLELASLGWDAGRICREVDLHPGEVGLILKSLFRGREGGPFQGGESHGTGR